MSRLHLIAITTGAIGLALVHLALYRDGSVLPLAASAVLLVFPAASGALAWRGLRADPVLLPAVALLTAVGLTEIYRLAPALIWKQALWILLGAALLLATVAVARDAFTLARYRYLVAGAALAFLAAALVFGREGETTRQWIALGPVSIQPSEVVKVLLVLFFASYLAEYRPVLSARHLPARVQLRALGPVLVVLGFSLALLAVQRDFGAAMLYFAIVAVMLYAATARADLVAGSGALFLLGMAAAYQWLPHVRTRVEIWWDPWAQASGRGYQLVQSLFGLAGGGLTGRGLGRGSPDLVPAAHTDFIFIAVGEELGYAGALALLLLFLLLIHRGIRIALRAPTHFTRLVATGVATVLGVQTLVILAGTLRLVPLTGVTLPFVSYGGSSIVSNFILLGMLLAMDAQRSAAPLPASADPRPLFRVAAVFSALFVAVMGTTAYWQVVRASELSADPRNPRLILAERRIHRGTIFDRSLRPLALSERAEGMFVRRYPAGPLFAHVVGYRGERLGKTGLEAALDQELLGLDGQSLIEEVRRRIAGGQARGLDAVLTVDAALQRIALQALAGRRGAVVVLDPRDGAVLAMVSAPGFDPQTVEEQWPTLQQAEGSPLLNRAAGGRYTPGSAFKIVTMAAALATGTARPETTFRDPGSIVVRNTRITNFEGQPCGTVTFIDALARSCNVVFITVGLRTGGEALLAQARAFGFDRAPDFELPAAAGHLPPREEVQGEGAGQMAFGQGSLAVTPLQMALMAAAIARGGEAVDPYLVREIRDPDGSVVRAHTAGSHRRAVDARIAAIIREGMVAVVQRGTGRGAALPNAQVAGKTGTATVPQGEPHAWFIGFAPAGAPRVAIAIVVEHGGIGGRVAAPIARRVLQRALQIVE